MANNEDDFDEFEDEDERQREAEERQREIEEHQREIERQQEEREREFEERSREFERENRRHERGHRHGRHPLPPIPPIPPVPPIPPMPPGSYFDDERYEDEQFFRSRKRKNITIRGMKTELYDSFSSKIQSQGLNLGIVISKMLLSATQKFNGDFPTITAEDILPPKKLMKLHIERKDSITFSKHDLEESEARLILRKIGKLTIADDVTDDLLKKHIDSIEHCELVLIPNTIPKLVALSLLRKCKAYEFY